MTVSRELVTRLSFAFDKTNLVKFERAISGFKTKFDIAKLEVGSLIQKVYDFTDAFASSVVQARNLSEFTGVAVKDFKALQIAVSKFGIEESTFNEVFKNISLGIKEASVGVNNFVNQLRVDTFGVVNFKKLNGELKTSYELFLDLSKLIAQTDDRSEKLRFLSNIPGIGIENSGDFLRFLEQKPEEIKRQIQNQITSTIDFEKSIESAQLFKQSMASMNQEFAKLSFTIGQKIIPYIAKALEGFNSIFSIVEKNGGGFLGLANASAEAAGLGVQHFAKNLFGTDPHAQGSMFDVKNDPYFKFLDNFNKEKQAAANTPTLPPVNFEFNVAAGTTEEQANYISEKVQMTLSNFKDEIAREVINNNPQVE